MGADDEVVNLDAAGGYFFGYGHCFTSGGGVRIALVWGR